MQFKEGDKVILGNTKQVAVFKQYGEPGRALVEIHTPGGPKTINVAEVILIGIKIAKGLWPLIRDIIDYFRGRGKQQIRIEKNDFEI